MRSRRVLIGIALLGTCASCARAPLFVADRSVRIVAPTELAAVAAPVRVAWRTGDLPENATQFAVFVDRAPIHPGQNLRSLADDRCRETAGCPDAAYLQGQGIFLTEGREIDIPYFATLGGLTGTARAPVHRVTIVLVDADGNRVGEHAYDVRFRLIDGAS